MKVYRLSIGSIVDSTGVSEWLEDREIVEANGRQYAASHCGTLLTAIGPEWSASQADAKRTAAERVSAMARTLLAQAQRLRDEADGIPA
jgi:hypothetical protein